MSLTKAERKKIIAAIAQNNPDRDLKLVDDSAYLKPMKHVLRGVLLAYSQYRGAFYLCSRVMPLYEGFDYPAAMWVDRILPPSPGKGMWDYVEDPNIMENVTATTREIIFPAIEGLDDFINLEKFQATNLRKYGEAPEIGYSLTLIALGRFDDAFAAWDSTFSKHRDWWQNVLGLQTERGVTGRARFLLQAFDAVRAKDWHGLAAMLRANEVKSAEALGVSDIWTPTPFPFEIALGIEAKSR